MDPILLIVYAMFAWCAAGWIIAFNQLYYSRQALAGDPIFAIVYIGAVGSILGPFLLLKKVY